MLALFISVLAIFSFYYFFISSRLREETHDPAVEADRIVSNILDLLIEDAEVEKEEDEKGCFVVFSDWDVFHALEEKLMETTGIYGDLVDESVNPVVFFWLDTNLGCEF